MSTLQNADEMNITQDSFSLIDMCQPMNFKLKNKHDISN